MGSDQELQAILTFMIGHVQYCSEHEGLTELQTLVHGDTRLARRARRHLDSRTMWPRGRSEGLLGELREDYQYDRAMRLLNAVIADEPPLAPARELQPLFDADRKADEVIDQAYELVHQGLPDEEIRQRFEAEELAATTRERIALRAEKSAPITSEQHRTVNLLLQIGGRATQINDQANIPGIDEFYELSDEEAFEQIALAVPQLHALRNVLGPEPLPKQAASTFRDFMRDRRKVRNSPEGAKRLESEQRVRTAYSELKHLVGPSAALGDDLVRSDLALFKCARYLFPSPSGFDQDGGGQARS
jgi:hypothetical protein